MLVPSVGLARNSLIRPTWLLHRPIKTIASTILFTVTIKNACKRQIFLSLYYDNENHVFTNDHGEKCATVSRLYSCVQEHVSQCSLHYTCRSFTLASAVPMIS